MTTPTVPEPLDALPAPTVAPLRGSAALALLALVASSGTLVCCVLPTVMVALGAGAALAGLVSNVPALIWLSAHKPIVFGAAFAMLLFSGAVLWWARHLPCPADPVLGAACARWRTISWALWWIAVALTLVGSVFAFVLPHLMA